VGQANRIMPLQLPVPPHSDPFDRRNENLEKR